MKPIGYVFLILFGILFGSELNGQSVSKEIGRLDSEDKPDSAYLLIDKYEKVFEVNGQWDSLVYLLHQKGKLYFRYKSVDEVRKVIEKTELIADRHLNLDNVIYLKFLKFKSDFAEDMGNYKEAEEIIDRIIKVSASIENDSLGISDSAKADKAFLFLKLGRIKESEALANSIYESIVTRGDTGQIIGVLQSLTVANHWLNRYDKSLKYAEESLRLIEKKFGKRHPNLGIIQDRIAEIYGDMGQVNKALEFFNKSKDIHMYNYEKSGSARILSTSIGNLGNYYADIGEYRLAMDYMSYGLELNIKEYGESSFNNMWYYSVLSTAARLYGDYDQADYFIDKAFDLIQKSDQSTEFDYKFFLGRKAEMLYTRDKDEEALPLALDVYNYFQKNEAYGSTNDRLHILNLITNIYIALKDYKNVYIWSKKNQLYHKENLDPLNSIRVNVLNGYLSFLTLNLDSIEAYKTKKEILKLRNKGNAIYTLSNAIPDSELLTFAANWVDFLFEMAKTNDSYKREYFEFIDDFEKYYPLHLATIKTNSNLAANEEYLKRIFSPGISYLYNTDPDKALLIAEKCKSFSTRQILQNQLIDDPNLPTLDYRLDNSTEVTEDNIPIDIFFNITASLDSVTVYKDSLFKQDRIKFEKYFGIADLSIEDIRSVLTENELMVEFFNFDSLIYAFYVDKSTVSCKSYSLSFIDSLATKILESRDLNSGTLLRSTLLPDNIIKGYKKLKILPDGILNSISFEQFYYDGKPLIYSKLISYGLSASVLLFQKKLTETKHNKNQFLGLTPGFTKDLKSKMKSRYIESDSGFTYLLQQPFLLSLSESLSRDFEGEIYQESGATENVFKSRAQDYRILHIGTHGILNDNSPLFSKLIFAKDSIEDGYLHAYELYGKNLNADLAVLSACSSGKEKTYASEGIVSLSHAFTHAGCPSVVMTKWDVDEKSTSIILKSFYENLRSGKSKSEALRDAKLTFLANSPQELHDPYYWAGLVLIGDDSAMFAQAWYKSGMGMVVLVLLICLLLFLGWKWWKT